MKTVRGLAVFAAAVTLSSTAHAATCKSQLARAEKATGSSVVPAYKALMKCDADIASQSFEKVMQNAGDAETLVGISMVAIEADQWNPVWGMIGKISDYGAQDDVAWLIGEQCAGNEKVVNFLQAGYFALKDIDFARWDDALVSCEADTFDAWMTDKIEDPPDKLFDEKWNAVATAYVERKGVEGLPHFAIGAVKAAEIGGPYEAILQHMEATVQPALGDEMPEADMSALADALSTVANGVTPEQARSVADRLANSGSEAAAAALLPTIYPDRVQSGGGFHYGAVAVELADCKGTQSAMLHVATVQDPGGRYMIQSAIDGPMRGMKPKLAKCTAAAGAWPVYVTEAPLAGKGDLEALVTSVADQWAAKDYAVKRKDEKPVVLD